MRTLEEFTRPNIRRLKPYSSARDEYSGAAASASPDANENSYNMPHNRYPDPMQQELKHELPRIKKISSEHTSLGNGSDGAIDLVFRVFCEPRIDSVIAIDPMHGMCQVYAEVNDMEYRRVLSDEDFQSSADKLLATTDKHTELTFLCSPNNPTGSDSLRDEIGKIIPGSSRLMVLDEACSDFSEAPFFLGELDKYPNLIVLQTFPRAWGCAAMCLGMAFASQEIISILSKIKYPYNVNQLTQKQALGMLHRYYKIERWVKALEEEHEDLEGELVKLLCTMETFPSDANFFLVWVMDATRIYNYLVGKDIIVHNRNPVSLCGSCLRVMVGMRLENEKLLEALRKI